MRGHGGTGAGHAERRQRLSPLTGLQNMSSVATYLASVGVTDPDDIQQVSDRWHRK